MTDIKPTNGFTLVELLVAMVVTSVVLTIVATLAFAMNSANNATYDNSQTQSQIRFSTLKISELIRHCKLICYVNSEELAIWRADDTPGGEGQINAGELVYIETGGNKIQLMDFSEVPAAIRTDPLSLTQLSGLKASLMSSCTERYAVLVPVCSNVQFGFLPELPPRSTFVTISFDIAENNIVHSYQINAALRGWAGNLLDTNDEIAADDD